VYIVNEEQWKGAKNSFSNLEKEGSPQVFGKGWANRKTLMYLRMLVLTVNKKGGKE
jgi:hypothetical protein